MDEKVKMIDDVKVVDITPEMTQEEEKNRINELAQNLLAFAKSRNKDKTA